jgi:transcriptional regulator with XRE-family HTH domain
MARKRIDWNARNPSRYSTSQIEAAMERRGIIGRPAQEIDNDFMLRIWRKKHGFTQTELAFALRVPQSVISRWEHKGAPVGLQAKLAALLAAPLEKQHLVFFAQRTPIPVAAPSTDKIGADETDASLPASAEPTTQNTFSPFDAPLPEHLRKKYENNS